MQKSKPSRFCILTVCAARIRRRDFVYAYDEESRLVSVTSRNPSVVTLAIYDYDNIVQSSGMLTSYFSFGFSTKYHDREVDLITYQLRTYDPVHGRWLNRDPIEEEGDLYVFVVKFRIKFFRCFWALSHR